MGVCLRNTIDLNVNYVLNLRLELVEVGDYEFSHPRDGTGYSQLYFKRLLLNTEFDRRGLCELKINFFTNQIIRFEDTALFLVT